MSTNDSVFNSIFIDCKTFVVPLILENHREWCFFHSMKLRTKEEWFSLIESMVNLCSDDYFWKYRGKLITPRGFYSWGVKRVEQAVPLENILRYNCVDNIKLSLCKYEYSRKVGTKYRLHRTIRTSQELVEWMQSVENSEDGKQLLQEGYVPSIMGLPEDCKIPPQISSMDELVVLKKQNMFLQRADERGICWTSIPQRALVLSYQEATKLMESQKLKVKICKKSSFKKRYIIQVITSSGTIQYIRKDRSISFLVDEPQNATQYLTKKIAQAFIEKTEHLIPDGSQVNFCEVSF